jgi:hypothetical protein
MVAERLASTNSAIPGFKKIKGRKRQALVDQRVFSATGDLRLGL